jgi:hypothetical protein
VIPASPLLYDQSLSNINFTHKKSKPVTDSQVLESHRQTEKMLALNLLSEIQKIVLNIDNQIIPHLNVTTGEWGLV